MSLKKLKGEELLVGDEDKMAGIKSLTVRPFWM